MMLESPMPFIAGIEIAETSFLQSVYPKMKANQKNRMLMVFLDSNNVSPYEFDPKDIFLPSFGGAWNVFLREFGKLHMYKKSKYFDLEKRKLPNKKEETRFKFKAKPDKKAQVNKSKPKLITLDQQMSNTVALTQPT
jgi:hypothetical protein